MYNPRPAGWTEDIFSPNFWPHNNGPSHPCVPSHTLLLAPGSMPVETCTPCGPREFGELSGSQWGPLGARRVGGTACDAIMRRCHFGQHVRDDEISVGAPMLSCPSRVEEAHSHAALHFIIPGDARWSLWGLVGSAESAGTDRATGHSSVDEEATEQQSANQSTAQHMEIN